MADWRQRSELMTALLSPCWKDLWLERTPTAANGSDSAPQRLAPSWVMCLFPETAQTPTQNKGGRLAINVLKMEYLHEVYGVHAV